MARCCVVRCPLARDLHATGVQPLNSFDTSWSLFVRSADAEQAILAPSDENQSIDTFDASALPPLQLTVQTGRVTAPGQFHNQLAMRLKHSGDTETFHVVLPRDKKDSKLRWRKTTPKSTDYYWFVATLVPGQRWVLQPFTDGTSGVVSREISSISLANAGFSAETVCAMFFGVTQYANYTVHEPAPASESLVYCPWPIGFDTTYAEQGYRWNPALNYTGGTPSKDVPGAVFNDQRQFMGVAPGPDASEIYASDWVQPSSSQTGYFLRWLDFVRKSQNYILYEDPSAVMLYGNKTDRAGFGTGTMEFLTNAQSNLFALRPFNLPRRPALTGGIPFSSPSIIAMLSSSVPVTQLTDEAGPLGWKYGAFVPQEDSSGNSVFPPDATFDSKTQTLQDWLLASTTVLPLGFQEKTATDGTNTYPYAAFDIDFSSTLKGELGSVQVGNNKGAAAPKPVDPSDPSALQQQVILDAGVTEGKVCRLYNTLAYNGMSYNLKSSAQLVPYMQVGSGTLKVRARVPTRYEIVAATAIDDPSDAATFDTPYAKQVQAGLQNAYWKATSSIYSDTGDIFTQYSTYSNFIFESSGGTQVAPPVPDTSKVVKGAMPNLVFAIWTFQANEQDLDAMRADTQFDPPLSTFMTEAAIYTNCQDWVGSKIVASLSFSGTTRGGQTCAWTLTADDGSVERGSIENFNATKAYQLISGPTLFKVFTSGPWVIFGTQVYNTETKIEFDVTTYATSSWTAGNTTLAAVSRKGVRPVGEQFVRGGPIDADSTTPEIFANATGPGFVPFVDTTATAPGTDEFDATTAVGEPGSAWTNFLDNAGVGIPLATISPWMVPNQVSSQPGKKTAAGSAACANCKNIQPDTSHAYDSTRTPAWWSAKGVPSAFTNEVKDKALFWAENTGSDTPSCTPTSDTSVPCGQPNMLASLYPRDGKVVENATAMTQQPGVSGTSLPQYSKQFINPEIDIEGPSNAPSQTRIPFDITDARFMTELLLQVAPKSSPGNITWRRFHCAGMGFENRVCAPQTAGMPLFVSDPDPQDPASPTLYLYYATYSDYPLPGDTTFATPTVETEPTTNKGRSGQSCPPASSTNVVYTPSTSGMEVKWAGFDPSGLFVSYQIITTDPDEPVLNLVRFGAATLTWSGTVGTLTFTGIKVSDAGDATKVYTLNSTVEGVFFPDTSALAAFPSDAGFATYWANTCASNTSSHDGHMFTFDNASVSGPSGYSAFATQLEQSLNVMYVNRYSTLNLNAYRWTNANGTGTYTNCFVQKIDDSVYFADGYFDGATFVPSQFHDYEIVWYAGGQNQPTDNSTAEARDHPRIDFFIDGNAMGTVDAMVPAFAGRVWITMWQATNPAWTGFQLLNSPETLVPEAQASRVAELKEIYYNWMDISEVVYAPQFDLTLQVFPTGNMVFDYSGVPNLPLRDLILPNSFDQPSIEESSSNAQPVVYGRTEYWDSTGAGSLAPLPTPLYELTAYTPFYSVPAASYAAALATTTQAFRLGWDSTGYQVLNVAAATYNGAPFYTAPYPGSSNSTLLYLQTPAVQTYSFFNVDEVLDLAQWNRNCDTAFASTLQAQYKALNILQGIGFTTVGDSLELPAAASMPGFVYTNTLPTTADISAFVIPYYPSTITTQISSKFCYYLVCTPPSGSSYYLKNPADSQSPNAILDGIAGPVVDVYDPSKITVLAILAQPGGQAVQTPDACTFSGGPIPGDFHNGPISGTRITNCKDLGMAWYPWKTAPGSGAYDDILPATTDANCFFHVDVAVGSSDVADQGIALNVSGAVGGPWVVAVNTAASPSSSTDSQIMYVASDEYGNPLLGTNVVVPPSSVAGGLALNNTSAVPRNRSLRYRVALALDGTLTASHLVPALVSTTSAMNSTQYYGWAFSPQQPMAIQNLGLYLSSAASTTASSTVIIMDVLDNQVLTQAAVSVTAGSTSGSTVATKPALIAPRLEPGRTYFIACQGIAGSSWMNFVKPRFALPVDYCGFGTGSGASVPTTVSVPLRNTWCNIGDVRNLSTAKYGNAFFTAQVLDTRDSAVEIAANLTTGGVYDGHGTPLDLRADLVEVNTFGWIQEP